MRFRVHRSSHNNRYGYDGEEDSIREELESPPLETAVYDRELSRLLWQHVWTVEVEDLCVLHHLSETTGHRIIFGVDDDSELPTLEVYDSYRE